MLKALALTQASSNAPETDYLFFALVGISAAVLALVFGLMFVYIVKYRAGSTLERGKESDKTWIFEIGWTAATLAVFLGLFFWAADLYFRLYQPSPDALKIYVVGKQWMWKIEHPDGQREINTLHIPVDRPIQLIMASEDVIHDFSIPAFRIKHDVVPGRYETISFTPTVAGNYHLFCTQFCGVDHATMGGEVVVMPAAAFQEWLAQNTAANGLAEQGRQLFIQYGCSGCHGGGTVRAPSLAGLFGSPVPLSDGTVVIADDRYIRDSILMPKSQVVASFAPIMPSYAGQITEENLFPLIAYIKSLAVEERR